MDDKTTITESALVKIGRSGRKTHVAQVTYEVTNPGTSRQRTRIVSAFPICGTSEATCGGHGRLGVQVIGPADGKRPTCSICDHRISSTQARLASIQPE